jgi:hypothetical protein
MRVNQVGVAAAVIAALAFGRALAADPPAESSVSGASASSSYEHTMAPGMDEAQPRASAPQNESALRLEGTGSGDGANAATNDRPATPSRDAVTYPLPDQDPELQRLLSQ